MLTYLPSPSKLILYSSPSILQHPPRYLLLENVVGFECSDTATMLRAVLAEQNYFYQEFNVSPCQLGIPYSRPRYFGLARKGQPWPETLVSLTKGIPFQGPPSLLHRAQTTSANTNNISNNNNVNSSMPQTPLGAFLASHMPPPQQHFCSCEDLYLSDEILRKHGWCLDMVGSGSTRVNCITKAYSHFLKGSGSVLATQQADLIPQLIEKFPPGERNDDPAKLEEMFSSLKQLNLRFLSPGEVAALHSFPASEFQFPESVSLRQRYQLLGNSLSVAVVADLLEYLLQDTQDACSRRS